MMPRGAPMQLRSQPKQAGSTEFVTNIRVVFHQTDFYEDMLGAQYANVCYNAITL